MTHDLSPQIADLTDEQRELLTIRLREARRRTEPVSYTHL